MRLITEIEVQKSNFSSRNGFEPNVVLIGINLKDELFCEVSKFCAEQVRGQLSGMICGLMIIQNHQMPDSIGVVYCKDMKR